MHICKLCLWDHPTLWDPYKIVTSFLAPLLQSLTLATAPWHFPGLSSCSFLAMSSCWSWILPHNLHLWALPSSPEEPWNPGLLLDLKRLVYGSTFYWTLGEKNWHLIHRNKTTSKDSNGYSCSQESPQSPQHQVLLLCTVPLKLLSPPAPRSRIPPFPPPRFSSTLPYFQIPTHFLCIAFSLFIVISFQSMSSDHHLPSLMQVTIVFSWPQTFVQETN